MPRGKKKAVVPVNPSGNPEGPQGTGQSHLNPVRIRFLKVWGHPTRNEIYGPGDHVWVSAWVANTLCNGGVAIRAPHARRKTSIQSPKGQQASPESARGGKE